MVELETYEVEIKPLDHKWVWKRRFTLECELCKSLCELEDGWPNLDPYSSPEIPENCLGEKNE